MGNQQGSRGKSKRDLSIGQAQAVNEQPAEPMPPKEEVLKLFEAFMTEKLISEQKKVGMRKMEVEMMWLMISSEKKVAKEGPDVWINKLLAGNGKLSLEDLQSFRITASGAGLSWMEEFVEKDGLKSCFALMPPTTHNRQKKIEYTREWLKVAKAFLNNEFGAQKIANTPNNISTIAQCVSTDDHGNSLVVDLLTIVCWLSEQGHKVVLASIENTNKLDLIKLMTDALLHTTDVRLKGNIVTFINILINTIAELDDRVKVRRKFLDDNILGIIKELQGWVATRKEENHLEEFRTVAEQCEAFILCHQQDQRETTRAGIDLSDLGAVMKLVKKNCEEDGYSEQFIGALHNLMVIPPNPQITKQVWNNFQYMTRFVSRQRGEFVDLDVKDESTEDVKTVDQVEQANKHQYLEIEELRELLDAKEGKDNIKLTKVVDEYKDRIQSLETELKTWEEQAKKGGKGGGVSNEVVDKLKKEVADLKKKLGGDNADDAPPDLGDDGPPDIGDDLFGDDDGPPDIGDDLFGDDDGPPDMGDMGDLFGEEEEKVPKIPPKTKCKPSVPLKTFFWDPIQPENIEPTLWWKMKDAKVKIDTKEIEGLFAKKVITKNLLGGKKKSPAQVGPTILDGNRDRNINIALARFKMTHREIRDAVLKMDTKKLNESRVATLLKISPDEHEVKKFKALSSEDQLTPSEAFCKQVLEVPQYQKRLQSWVFRLQGEESFHDITHKINTYNAAVAQIDQNPKWKKVLELILAIGNYLNGTGRVGGAYGFKLKAITKLADTRTADGKSNLGEYLVKTIEKMDEKKKDSDKLRNFITEMKDCVEASHMDFSVAKTDYVKFTSGMRKINAILKAPVTSSKDKYKSYMSSFYNQMSKKGEAVQKTLDSMEETGKKLVELYGENPEKYEFPSLIKTIGQFIEQFQRYEKQIVEKQKKLEREAKRGNLFKKRKSQSKGDMKQEGVGDKILRNLKGGNAQQMLAAINKKRAQKTTKFGSGRRYGGGPQMGGSDMFAELKKKKKFQN